MIMRTGIVHRDADGTVYTLVEDCPAKPTFDLLGLPPMRCFLGVGPSPEESPNMAHCHYVNVEESEPMQKDKTIRIACCYPEDE